MKYSKLLLLLASYIFMQIIIAIFYDMYIIYSYSGVTVNLYSIYRSLNGLFNFQLILQIGLLLLLLNRLEQKQVLIPTIIYGGLLALFVLGGFVQSLFVIDQSVSTIGANNNTVMFTMYYQIPIVLVLIYLFIVLVKSEGTKSKISWVTLGLTIYVVLTAIVRNISYIFRNAEFDNNIMSVIYATNTSISLIVLSPLGLIILGFIVYYLIKEEQIPPIEVEEQIQEEIPLTEELN